MHQQRVQTNNSVSNAVLRKMPEAKLAAKAESPLSGVPSPSLFLSNKNIKAIEVSKGAPDGCVAKTGDGLVKVAIILTALNHRHLFHELQISQQNGVTSLRT